MLGLFTFEVLFEQIDLVVLSDAVASGVGQLRGCHLVSEVHLSKHLLLVLQHVVRLGMVRFLGPA